MLMRDCRILKGTGLAVFFVLAAVFAWCPPAVFCEEAESDQERCDLGPLTDLDKSPAFRRLLKMEPGAPGYERARIDFLVERVRKSPADFIWNGQAFNSARAALHMQYKYVKYRSEASTAEDFVANIASRSRKTGRLYLIETGSMTCELRNLLFEELERLDRLLEEKKKETANAEPHVEIL
ncbi:MAG: hypothetical protein BWY42_00669 [Candidatus Omnitrophica bacterium ADurb.Bin277]|jgi:hypothetical protein|nr:MAG: hypothetical protein BWY42_00669 [Candidatus Omnitrophica bacterium ADurb.Bin277]